MLSSIVKPKTLKYIYQKINNTNICALKTHISGAKKLHYQFSSKDSIRSGNGQPENTKAPTPASSQFKRSPVFSSQSNYNKGPKTKRKNSTAHHEQDNKQSIMTEKERQEKQKKDESKILRQKQKQLIYNGDGYGYFDWSDQAIHKKAMQEEYFLDDLITGCRKLKSKNIDYNQDQIKFILHTCVLFPQHQSEFVNQVLPALQKKQQQPDFYLRVPSYFSQIKFVCCQSKFRNHKKQSGEQSGECCQLIHILENRIHHPYNNKDLQSIYNSVNHFGYIFMESYEVVFNRFKTMFFEELINKQYKLSPQKIKMAAQLHIKLMMITQRQNQSLFFSDFPDIFQRNQQIFQNMIQLLLQMLNLNIIKFMSIPNDLEQLNLRISNCTQFKEPKTKKLLSAYAEHLVLLQIEQYISFTHLLQTI